MRVRMDSNQKQQQRQQTCCICVTQPNHLFVYIVCLAFYSLVINVIGGDDTGHDVLLCCGDCVVVETKGMNSQHTCETETRYVT